VALVVAYLVLLVVVLRLLLTLVLAWLLLMGLTPASAGLAPGVANLAPPAMSGVGLSPAATSVGLMDTLQKIPKSFGEFSRENPFTTKLAGQAAEEEFRQKQVQNPGLLRGRPADEQAMQYSSPIPKISLL